MAWTKEQKAAFDALAKLGGSLTREQDVLVEGTKYVIPKGVTYKRASQMFAQMSQDLETITDFSRQYTYRPWDGANAVAETIKNFFGFGIPKTIRSFFGNTPPQLISIQTGVDSQVQVPWGAITLPGLEDTTLYLDSYRHRELGSCFQILVQSPKKNQDVIEGFFNAVQMHLETASIYRGKAIDGAETPNFIDTSSVTPDDVVYSAEVMGQLEANVWSPIIHEKALRKLRQPSKRSVLLEGPFGSGKTLAALLTAQVAEANGYTFIMCRPGVDDFHHCLMTANMYEPAVLFLEDVDVIAEAGEGADAVTKVLDAFDGLRSKGKRLLLCLTTNYVERIHKAMLRPGRLDAVIHIGEMDRAGVERLTRRVIGDALSETCDHDAVFQATKGFMPAFVKEALDRSIRYSLARNNGELGMIDTEDLVLAASGLRRQLDLMNGAHDTIRKPSVDQAIGTVVEAQVKGVLSSTGLQRQGYDDVWGVIVEIGDDGEAVVSSR